MRTIVIFLLGGLSGCGGSALECGAGTHEEDGVCVPGDTDTGTEETGSVDDGHPLAPDKYKWLWNVEGSCETYGNRSGNQVYILAEDVRIESGGAMSGTEKWYWFQEGEGWEGDCVDTFEVTGTPRGVDKAQYQCSECEETYDIVRKPIDIQCSLNYNYFLFDYDWKEGFPDGDPADSYPAFILLDTLNPNGNPNEDNKMLMLHVKGTEEGEILPGNVDNDFARGHAVSDDVSQPGPPGTYDWLADKCIRTSF